MVLLPSACEATTLARVVASHADGCKVESRLWLSCTDLYYARGAQGIVPMRVGAATNQLDLVSDAIVPNWLWSTVTRSSPLGYFGRLLHVVDN